MAEAIAIGGCHTPGPRLALGARPLEAVIAVAQALRADLLPAHVILAVGRGNHHAARARMLEDHPLHRAQARRVQMLNYFNQRDDIKTFQAAITIEYGALRDLDTFALRGWQPIQMQAPSGKC